MRATPPLRADPEERRARGRGRSREAAVAASELVARGLEHARRFTWRPVGETMLAAWEQPRLNVGIDVAPLVLDNAGTARYVRGLLDGLSGARATCDVQPVSWGGSGRLTAAVRDVAWYPVALPLRLAIARRPPLHDLPRARCVRRCRSSSRCTTSPSSGSPSSSPPGRARTRARCCCRCCGRRGACSPSPSSRGARSSSSRACPRTAIDVAYNAADRDGLHARTARRADGDYVLAVGTLEPRKNLPRLIEATGRLGLELRVAGAAGWGAVESPRRTSRWLGRPTDDELAAAAARRALPRLSVAATRASASRCSRRCSAAPRSSRARAARWRRWPATRPSSSTRRRRRRSRPGSSARSARRAELRAAGLARARRFGWAATAEATVTAYRKAVGVSRRSSSIDADVLGRRRTGDETYVAESAARAAGGSRRSCGFVAVTRHPELVPDGVEPVELPARIQELRMAWSLPRLLRRLRPDARRISSTRCRSAAAAAAVVTVHDLTSSATRASWGRSTGSSSRPSCRARRVGRTACSPSRSGRRTTLVELYGDLAGEDDRDAARRRPGVRAGGDGGGTAATCSSSARSRRARTRSPRSPPPRRSGLPLVVAGPEKEPALARELRARGADLRGYVTRAELADLYRARRGARPAVALRGVRPAGARGDGVRRRRSSTSADAGAARGRRRCRRVRRRRRRPRRGASRARSPTATGSSRAGLERAQALLVGARRRGCTADVYRRCFAVRVGGGRRLARASRPSSSSRCRRSSRRSTSSS